MDKSGDFGRRKWQASEVEGDASGERGGIGGGCGSEAVVEEASEDQLVEGILGPACLFLGELRGKRRLRFFEFGERPMAFPFGARLHPLLEKGDLLGLEGFIGFGGRHEFIAVGGMEAGGDFAPFPIPGDDGDGTAFAFAESACGGIEAEIGFPMFFIGPVAGEAMIGEDGADIAIKRGWGGVERGKREEGEDEKETGEAAHK